MSQCEAIDVSGLYERHAGLVRSVVARFLRNPPDVEETVQDVFVQAYQQVRRFDPQRGNECAWLTTIARTRALDRLRYVATRRATGSAAAEELQDRDEWNPASQAEATEVIARVRRGWERLSPEVQEVLRLTYEEDLPQRSVADRMCLSLGVVKSRMRQGLASLRGTLNTACTDPTRSGPITTNRALTVMFAQPTTGSAGPRILSNIQVLLVDDDARTREAVGAVLRQAGARPLLQSSVEQACATLDHLWPDILIADISMPTADGYCLIEQVRQREQRTGMTLPAIAFTAMATERDRTRALLAGYRLHLSKPVHPLAIISAIARVLEPTDSESRCAGVA